MKEIRKRDLTSDSRVQNSPDEFDRAFSARYRSEVDKISLSEEQKKLLKVKLYQANEESMATETSPAKKLPVFTRSARAAVAAAAALAVLVGGIYIAGGSANLFGNKATLDEGGKALSEEDMAGNFDGGMEVAGESDDTAEKPGRDNQGATGSPSQFPPREGYLHYRSTGGSSEPHDFYYIAKSDESFTRIQIQIGKPSTEAGKADVHDTRDPETIVHDQIDPALPEPMLPDTEVDTGEAVDGDLPGFIDGEIQPAYEEFTPSSLVLLDRIVVEARNGESWAVLSDAAGTSEFKLSAQLDEMAKDLYKPIENGQIVIPTPIELVLGFNFGLENGREYRIVLQTGDETVLLPFVFNH